MGKGCLRGDGGDASSFALNDDEFMGIECFGDSTLLVDAWIDVDIFH